ncbi:hypothetical protein KAW43_03325 [Candidatus Parcubacteria bacterium]|nr:hypothetical protein [Candidatus Parcubacteria bacterium]
MMKNKKCLKCGSQNFYRGLLKGFDTGIGGKRELTFFTRRPEAQVCLDCGHIELYLNEKDLEKLKKKFKK